MTQESLRIIREEHMALAAMLRSLSMMIDRGPAKDAENFFDVLRAMLFYIDEFPEKRHHPKESDLLFPRVVRLAPETFDAVVQLEKDHANGETAVRDLQHLLLAWELLGESRRSVFEQAAKRYVSFYLEHMRLEEHVILPAAQRSGCWTTRTGPNWMPPSPPIATRSPATTRAMRPMTACSPEL